MQLTSVEDQDSLKKERGFTLLELLIAISLLALLAVMMSSGLHFGVRVWEKNSVATSRLEKISLTQEFLRQAISKAYPHALKGDSPGKIKIDFHGQEHHLDFLTPMPEALGAAGLARMSLDVEESNTGSRLILSWRPELAPDDPTLDRHATLLANIAEVSFSYFGSAKDTLSWTPDWDVQATLPALIRIHVSFRARDSRIWPDLIVAPRLQADAMCIINQRTHLCAGHS